MNNKKLNLWDFTEFGDLRAGPPFMSLVDVDRTALANRGTVDWVCDVGPQKIFVRGANPFSLIGFSTEM